MKIYLAATAPGTEAREKAPEIMCGLVHHRLLSYYHITINELFCAVVFDAIRKVKGGKRHEADIRHLVA